MKLGILGGTFDPIHLGHLLIAEEARTRLGLAQVLFIPTGCPWLKQGRPIAPGHHRLAMTRLAVQDNPHFAVSTLELERPGPSYTVDTLDALRRDYGEGVSFYFIVGLDSLEEFHRWKEPARILTLCTLVAVVRPGHQQLDRDALEAILPGAAGRVELLQGPAIGISGTEIRRRVAQGLSIRYWVPRPVEEYIHRHRLYQEGEPP